MKDLSTLSTVYINLNNNELKRLTKQLENKNQSIDWWSVIDRSKDADPLRATAIDKARIRTAMRYHETGGPKKRRTQDKRKEIVMSRTEIRKRGL